MTESMPVLEAQFEAPFDPIARTYDAMFTQTHPYGLSLNARFARGIGYSKSVAGRASMPVFWLNAR